MGGFILPGDLTEAGVLPKEIKNLLGVPFSYFPAGFDRIIGIEVRLTKLNLVAEIAIFLFFTKDCDPSFDFRLICHRRSIAGRWSISCVLVSLRVSFTLGDEPTHKFMFAIGKLLTDRRRLFRDQFVGALWTTGFTTALPNVGLIFLIFFVPGVGAIIG